MNIKDKVEYIVRRANELALEGNKSTLECIYIAEQEIRQIEADLLKI